jgi:hypothetical protein
MWKEPVLALSRYCPGTCLMELKKTTKNFIQSGRCPGRDSKRALPNTSIQLYHWVILLHLFFILLHFPFVLYLSSLCFVFSTSSSCFPSTSLSAQLRVRGPRDPINYVCQKEDSIPLDVGAKTPGSWKEKCWWGPSSSLKIWLNMSLSNYLKQAPCLLPFLLSAWPRRICHVALVTKLQSSVRTADAGVPSECRRDCPASQCSRGTQEPRYEVVSPLVRDPLIVAVAASWRDRTWPQDTFFETEGVTAETQNLLLSA